MAADTEHKRQDSRDYSGELSPRASSASAFTLFLDLGAKPMSALDVNFEVLHSRVMCMPGEYMDGFSGVVCGGAHTHPKYFCTPRDVWHPLENFPPPMQKC